MRAFGHVSAAQPRARIPLITTNIRHAAVAIAVWLVHRRIERFRSRLQRALIHRIDIFNVQVNRSWKSIALPSRTGAATANHDARFTDLIFSMEAALCAESVNLTF